MHVHVGALDFLKFLLMLAIANFLMRSLAGRFKDSAFGQALAFIY